MPAREFSRKGASGALQSVAGGVLAVSNTVLREALHAGAKVVLANQYVVNPNLGVSRLLKCWRMS